MFSRSVFSGSAFSRSAFSRSAFSRSMFSRSVFSRSAVCGLRFRGLCFRDTLVFVGVSFRKTLTRLVMTTSVRFTGVFAQGKMNNLFIFHRNFFLLNLIDRAVDLKPTWQES